MQDLDPVETQEWLDALESVLDKEGEDRAHYLMTRLGELATRSGSQLPYAITTPYRNTIPVTHEARMPGDLFMERRIRSLVRWNALAMVVKTNIGDPDLGGHISSFASSATLYDIGFNYFFQAPTDEHGGDLIYFQGHASPGVYARAFMEGRITEEQMTNFRQEVDGNGLSSYPHPWLMKDFWQFPTVSMGLGPIQAIYQARFMKYTEHRGYIPEGKQKVWCFLGDGETDEPESLGAIALAGREKLDNLIFVVNCNLQRLDGPVRGNAKIIQNSKACSVAPNGTSPKSSGAVSGTHCWPRTSTVSCNVVWTKSSTANTRTTRPRTARSSASTSSTRLNSRPWLPICPTTRSGNSTVAATTRTRSMRPITKPSTTRVNRPWFWPRPSRVMAPAPAKRKHCAQHQKVDVDSLRHFRDRFDIPVKDSNSKPCRSTSRKKAAPKPVT